MNERHTFTFIGDTTQGVERVYTSCDICQADDKAAKHHVVIIGRGMFSHHHACGASVWCPECLRTVN